MPVPEIRAEFRAASRCLPTRHSHPRGIITSKDIVLVLHHGAALWPKIRQAARILFTSPSGRGHEGQMRFCFGGGRSRSWVLRSSWAGGLVVVTSQALAQTLPPAPIESASIESPEEAARTDQRAADEPAQGATPVAATQLLLVEIHTDTPELSADELRQAVARELGVLVVAPSGGAQELELPKVVISLRREAGELAVSYSHPSRGALARIVAVPETMPEIVSLAALLAGNLARDEAHALLSSQASPPAASSSVSAPVAVSPKSPSPVSPEIPERPRAFANAAFFFPLAFNHELPELEAQLDFNLIYGRIGKLEGFSLGTVSTVSGPARGLAIALLAHSVGETAGGVEIAGLFNSVGGALHGLQIAGVFNRTRGSVRGFQLAGVANVSESQVEGAQITPFGLNYSGGRVDGFQIGGLANLAAQRVRGAQLALGFNRAGDVEGAQIGLINVGGNVEGLQIGLINVARDVKGVPIGLVSVTRSGGVHPVAWASSSSHANLGVKFATRYTYTLFSASAHRISGDGYAYGPGLALGAAVPIFPRTFVETDVGATHLFGDTRCCADFPFWSEEERASDQTLIKLRSSVRYAFLKHFSLFVGTGVVGRVGYPSDPERDAPPNLELLGEAFGGIQL